MVDIGWQADASDVGADYRQRRIAREHKSATRRGGRMSAFEHSDLTAAEYALQRLTAMDKSAEPYSAVTSHAFTYKSPSEVNASINKTIFLKLTLEFQLLKIYPCIRFLRTVYPQSIATQRRRPRDHA